MLRKTRTWSVIDADEVDGGASPTSKMRHGLSIQITLTLITLHVQLNFEYPMCHGPRAIHQSLAKAISRRSETRNILFYHSLVNSLETVMRIVYKGTQ